MFWAQVLSYFCILHVHFLRVLRTGNETSSLFYTRCGDTPTACADTHRLLVCFSLCLSCEHATHLGNVDVETRERELPPNGVDIHNSTTCLHRQYVTYFCIMHFHFPQRRVLTTGITTTSLYFTRAVETREAPAPTPTGGWHVSHFVHLVHTQRTSGTVTWRHANGNFRRTASTFAWRSRKERTRSFRTASSAAHLQSNKRAVYARKVTFKEYFRQFTHRRNVSRGEMGCAAACRTNYPWRKGLADTRQHRTRDITLVRQRRRNVT